MRRPYLLFVMIFVFSILVCNTEALDINENLMQDASSINYTQKTISDDFYFVHITDTHVMHKIFDRNEVTKNRLKTVLNHVCSFVNKPAFIVITGDLTEWGGSRISGALNCIAFASCFYKNDGQFYADVDYTIPVYTTPGNHDYCFNRNLNNYLKYIKNEELYIKNFNDVSLFFINTGPNYYAEPDDWLDINGNGLSDIQIDWLDDSLNNCSSSYKIILMHHPAINKRNSKGEMTDIIANNRERFIELCISYNVDLVLAGHTHDAIVFGSNEEIYDNLPINCSQYDTLFVQSDDCKQSINYRNITFFSNDIWIEKSTEINTTFLKSNDDFNINYYKMQNIFQKIR